MALLKRFRVADTEGGRGPSLTNPSDIQALFQELESLSCDEDSGAEQDTMSISSTPKPSLRPFFSSSRSLLEHNNQPTATSLDVEKIGGDDKNYSGSDGNADICWTDYEAQQSDPQTGSPPREKGSASKFKQMSDFDNFLQETNEKKNKLFRTSASSGKKKNSLSIGTESAPPVEVVTVGHIFVFRTSCSININKHERRDCT